MGRTIQFFMAFLIPSILLLIAKPLFDFTYPWWVCALPVICYVIVIVLTFVYIAISMRNY